MLTHPTLSQLAMFGVKLGLDRVNTFLQHLGEPHRAYPVVHVAGTNGKGSVCAMVTAALVEAGYRVGTTYSPHVEQLNERVQIDGRPIDDSLLTEAIEHVDRARRDWGQTMGLREAPLTYFEFMTVVAFVVFAWRNANVAVIETGLGGRLDATNVVKPQVTAIPHIGFDHQAFLGDSLKSIAAEKAGIFERRVPVVLGTMPVEARTELLARAKRLGSPVWKPGSELRREVRRDGTVSIATPAGSIQKVKLGLEGDHQAANATVAVGILHQLRAQGFLIEDEHIRAGLQNAWLPGRLERLLPALVVDGAHNVDGAKVLASWLERQPRPGNRILLWGMGGDRDAVKIIQPLLPHFDEIVTTRCAHPKAVEPVELALRMQELDALLAAGGSIEETLPEVYAEADETVVAGSLFLAGAARALVREGALDGIEPGQGPAEPVEELEVEER